MIRSSDTTTKNNKQQQQHEIIKKNKNKQRQHHHHHHHHHQRPLLFLIWFLAGMVVSFLLMVMFGGKQFLWITSSGGDCTSKNDNNNNNNNNDAALERFSSLPTSSLSSMRSTNSASLQEEDAEDSKLTNATERSSKQPQQQQQSPQQQSPQQQQQQQQQHDVISTTRNNDDDDKIYSRAYRKVSKLPCFAVVSSANNNNNDDDDIAQHRLTHNAPVRGKPKSYYDNMTHGFLFLKPTKVGGSTVRGIQFRISRRHSSFQRYNSNNNTTNSTHDINTAITNNNNNEDTIPHSNIDCSVGYYRDHGLGTDFEKRDRMYNNSFLYSWIRHPTKRLVSEFFHFAVSRDKIEPTDENFMRYLNHHHPPTTSTNNNNNNNNYYYVETHQMRRHGRIRNPIQKIQRVFDEYDFFGITERFDESVVVLQLLLGLSTADVLYVADSKRHGSFDDGMYKNTCTYIVPSFISPSMQAYFTLSNTTFKARIRSDMMFYEMAQKSLNRTIDETIGRGRFQEALTKFQNAQAIVARHCKGKVIYPCSEGGQKRRPEETNCLWIDSGCGNDCIDEAVEKYGIQ